MPGAFSFIILKGHCHVLTILSAKQIPSIVPLNIFYKYDNTASKQVTGFVH